MIEQIVSDYLEKKLMLPVYPEKPKSPPAEYILVEKTGSSEEDFIYSATITLQSYAGSLCKAAALNEMAKCAMRSIITLDEITSAKLNTDYNFTDTTKKQYRYQAVYDLVYTGGN